MSEKSTQDRSYIDSIVRQEEQALEQRSIAERFADAVGMFAGSPFFIALHLALLTTWLLINSGSIPWIRPFDPYPFSRSTMRRKQELSCSSRFWISWGSRISGVHLR
jgi:uncharacterized membrane protein